MSRFAGIQSALKTTAAIAPVEPTELPDDPDNIEGDETETKSKKKDKEMTEEEKNALKADAKAEGFKEANVRMNAVFASEEYAGREQQAHSFLTNDKLAHLGGDDIVAMLATAPKIEASAIAPAAVSQERTEEIQREEMRAAMAGNPNANIDLGAGGGEPSAQADDSLIKSMKSRFGDKN